MFIYIYIFLLEKKERIWLIVRHLIDSCSSFSCNPSTENDEHNHKKNECESRKNFSIFAS